MPDPKEVSQATDAADRRTGPDLWTPGLPAMVLAEAVGQELCAARDFGTSVVLAFSSGAAFRVHLGDPLDASVQSWGDALPGA